MSSIPETEWLSTRFGEKKKKGQASNDDVDGGKQLQKLQRMRDLLREADDLIRAESFSDAVKKLDHALALNDGNFILIRKARCHIGQKNYDEALNLIKYLSKPSLSFSKHQRSYLSVSLEAHH